MKSTSPSHYLPQVSNPTTQVASSTLTRADIADNIYREIGLSKTESADLLESMIDHIINSLVAGEIVKLSGFGVFSTREKGARPGRNPKTGEPVIIGARRVISFKSSNKIKDRVSAAQ